MDARYLAWRETKVARSGPGLAFCLVRTIVNLAFSTK